MANHFYVRVSLEKCKGCELCVEACPRDLLVMTKRLNSTGYRVPDNHSDALCVGCRQCADMCPEAAIEIDKQVADDVAAAANAAGEWS